MGRAAFLLAWGAVALAVGLGRLVGLDGAVDRRFHDLVVRLTERAYDGPVVVVAVDQPSLRELRGWPWPRSRHARLIRRLTAAGASVVGLDIDFGSPSDPREDAALAEAIRASGRVVLGAFKEERVLEGGLAVEYAGVPLPALAGGAAAVGSILVPLDADGAVRRVRLRDSIRGEPLWAFGLEVARLHLRVPPERLAAGAGADGALVLDYAAGRPPVVSYADALAGRVPDRMFAGRIVLVGATALELQDLRPTPLGRLTPGVQIQGHVADTLVGGGAVPVGWPLAAAVAAAVALPVLAAARGRRRAVGVALALLPAPLGLLAAGLAAAHGRLLVPPGPFVTAGLAAAAAHGVGEWASLRRELARVRARLRVLADLGRRIDTATGVERSVETVLEVVRELIGLERLIVELADGRVIGAPPLRGPAAGLEPRAGARLEIPLAGAGGSRGRLVAAALPGRSLGGDEEVLLQAIAARVAADAANRSLADDLRALHLSVIHSLAVAIEMRNAYTGQHCEGVARRAAGLAEAFGLAPDAIERIRIGGLLHDIGKIGVPEPILLKPGRFTAEEYEVMKQHAAIGHKIIAALPFAEEVKDYVRHHHEHYDGTGYPDGLAGDRLSLGARIVAVADCYEALVTDRPYRPARTPREAMSVIRAGSGTRYAPEVVARLEAALRAEGVSIDGPAAGDGERLR